MARKNLNDLLSNDRSVARAARYDDGKGDEFFGTGSFKGSSYGGYKETKRCYHSHPPLKIGDYVVYGGSCSSPSITDADVYIGFDWGMRPIEYKPWERDVAQVYHPITDMMAPKDPVAFVELLHWTKKQLEAGKKVHCGCIGGHGRTGTFLAALYCLMTGDKDAITYVRKNYCHKVVESTQQVKFLHELMGINKVSSSKASYSTWQEETHLVPSSGKKTKSKSKLDKFPMDGFYSPLSSKVSIFGKPL